MVDPEGFCRCPVEGTGLHLQKTGKSARPDAGTVLGEFYAAVERESLVEASLRRSGRAASGRAVGGFHVLLDRDELHRSDVPSVALEHRCGGGFARGA